MDKYASLLEAKDETVPESVYQERLDNNNDTIRKNQEARAIWLQRQATEDVNSDNYKKYAEAVVKAVTEYAGYKYVPLAGSDYYVVKKGDTLWDIPKEFGSTVDGIARTNGIEDRDKIYPGQKLYIPKFEKISEKVYE